MALERSSKKGGPRSMKVTCLIMIQLLLNEQALCRTAPPLAQKNNQLLETDANGEVKETNHGELKTSLSQLIFSSPEKEDPAFVDVLEEGSLKSAGHLISSLREMVQTQIQSRLHFHGNISCEDLLSASAVDDSLPFMFPRELLGLSLVPVMVMAGCPEEAQTLVLKLYDLLGKTDTEELLVEVQNLMERKLRKSTPASATSSSERKQIGRHIEAVLFNIQQMVKVGEQTTEEGGPCDIWTRVNGTVLVGKTVEGTMGGLEEAVNSCESLGILCAGVTRSGPLTPATYRAVLKQGSRILPSASLESESWIHQCHAKEHISIPAGSGHRMKRSPPVRCINANEEQVYSVVEWIPAVSTLYNLGTAVYYASLNCSETAKERAILSAVDLGTDTLMIATGGTAGVAGYAVGAGVKTGVKAGVRYLLNSMKQDEDIMVNQFSWDQGDIIIQ